MSKFIRIFLFCLFLFTPILFFQNCGPSRANHSYLPNSSQSSSDSGAPSTVTPISGGGSGSGAGGGSGGSSGAIDLSACTAAGFTGHGYDAIYPLTGNRPRVFTDQSIGVFSDNDMIVIRFTAPMTEITPGAVLGGSEYSSWPAAFRLATLSTSPCVVAKAPGASGNILASSLSQGPHFNMSVTTQMYMTKLTPGQTYYMNIVNRDAYNSSYGSCAKPNCAMFIDFNN